MYPENEETTDLIKTIKGHILDSQTRIDTVAQLWINQHNEAFSVIEDQNIRVRQDYEKNVDQFLTALVQVLYREWDQCMKTYRVIAYQLKDPNSYDVGYELTEEDAQNRKTNLLNEGYQEVQIEQIDIPQTQCQALTMIENIKNLLEEFSKVYETPISLDLSYPTSVYDKQGYPIAFTENEEASVLFAVAVASLPRLIEALDTVLTDPKTDQYTIDTINSILDKEFTNE